MSSLEQNHKLLMVSLKHPIKFELTVPSISLDQVYDTGIRSKETGDWSEILWAKARDFYKRTPVFFAATLTRSI